MTSFIKVRLKRENVHDIFDFSDIILNLPNYLKGLVSRAFLELYSYQFDDIKTSTNSTKTNK